MIICYCIKHDNSIISLHKNSRTNALLFQKDIIITKTRKYINNAKKKCIFVFFSKINVVMYIRIDDFCCLVEKCYTKMKL